MAAPEGNRFWEARAKHGRDKIFASPEMLWQACLEYFEWNEANPLWESKAFNAAGEIKIAELPKMRAMTIAGLCQFLGIGRQTWHDYESREDFSEITARAVGVIRRQKFEGASADLLNANIIARDLGLSDRQEVESTVKVDDATKHAAESFARGMARLAAAGDQGQPSGDADDGAEGAS